MTEKYEEVFSGILSEIKTINYWWRRTRVNTDDEIPLKKPVKFPTLIIIIRCVIQNGETLSPQIYSDECLYQL